MERVYTNYTASSRQVVLHNVPASFANITVENIRLIFNETQKDEKGEALDPLASTGKKDNILSVTYNGTAKTVTIVLADTVPAIASTDKLTIKVDMGDGLEDIGTAIVEIDTSLLALESTTAKEATVAKDATVAKEAQATLNKEAIIAAIPTVNQIQSGLAKSSEIPSVADIQNGLAKESDLSSVASNVNNAKLAAQSAQISASSASTYSLRLNQFFGIVGSVQGYEAIPLGEMLSELEEIMQAIDPDLTAAQAAAISDEATQIDPSGTGRAIFAPSDVIVPNGYAKNVRDYKLYVEEDGMLG